MAYHLEGRLLEVCMPKNLGHIAPMGEGEWHMDHEPRRRAPRGGFFPAIFFDIPKDEPIFEAFVCCDIPDEIRHNRL